MARGRGRGRGRGRERPPKTIITSFGSSNTNRKQNPQDAKLITPPPGIKILEQRTNTINGTVTAVKKLQLSDTPPTFSKVDESRPSTNDYNVSVHRAPIPTDDLQISEEIPPDLAEEEHQRKGKRKATAETWV
ncbi:hypothetical protein FXO37_23307 [Capsicum annuum]|nr:hypothetical protein FXO37_23307 [Capsicum annuum]